MTSTFEHHETLYFADGNICLSAGHAATRLDGDSNAEAENSKILVFRVHQGVLSLHSPVFKDMLAFSEPQPGTNEVYEGVPLVQMPDSAEALESLINAFYHGYELPHPKLDPRTPDAVRSILLLANKYQVDSIRRRIIERLESDWPQSIQLWDRLEAEIEVMKAPFYDEYGNAEVDGLPMDDILPEPASAIRLARDCDIPSILPAAFYHLSRLSIEHDWERARRTPGEYTEFSQFYGPKQRTAHWSLFDGEDMRRVLRGKAKILKYARLSAITRMCSGPGDTNLGPGTCEFLVNGLFAGELWERLMKFAERDMAKGLKVIMQEVYSSQHKVCHNCLMRSKNCLDGETFWSKLPEFFELA